MKAKDSLMHMKKAVLATAAIAALAFPTAASALAAKASADAEAATVAPSATMNMTVKSATEPVPEKHVATLSANPSTRVPARSPT